MKSLAMILSLALLMGAYSASALVPKVGKQYFLAVSGTPIVTVLGQEEAGRHIIRYESGYYAGKLGSGLDMDFVKMSDCAQKGYCVGDRFLVPSREYVEATIAGVNENEIVLRFDSGSYGCGWHPRDLISIRYEQYKRY